ncbi:MAG: hypothetical protein ACJ79R_22810 [Anaeromyxobacteraceae bacterium]
MTTWVSLFDVAHDPFRWGTAGEGLLAVALVAMGFGVARAVRRRFAIAAFCAALALAAGYVAETMRHRAEHAACAEAARRGDGRVLEGVARDVRAAPRWAGETFVVAGETVECPLVAERCGFTRAVVGDALHDGARVRVRVWDGQVVKLEVAP